MRIIFEIPPAQVERLLVLLKKLLPQPWQLMALILGLTMLVGALAVLLFLFLNFKKPYRWELKKRSFRNV
jgi:hypothetical protein